MPKNVPAKPVPFAAKVSLSTDAKGQTHLILTPSPEAGIGTEVLKFTPHRGSQTERRIEKALINTRLAKMPTRTWLPDGTRVDVEDVSDKRIVFRVGPDLMNPEREISDIAFHLGHHNALEGYLPNDVHSDGTDEQKLLMAQIGALIPVHFGTWLQLQQDQMASFEASLGRFLAPGEDVPVSTQEIQARKVDVEHVLVLAAGTRVVEPTKADPTTFRSRPTVLKEEVRAVVREVTFEAWDDYAVAVLIVTSYGKTYLLQRELTEEVTLLTGEHGRYERMTQFEDSALQKRIDADYEASRPGIEAMKEMIERRFGAGSSQRSFDKTVLAETIEIANQHSQD